MHEDRCKNQINAILEKNNTSLCLRHLIVGLKPDAKILVAALSLTYNFPRNMSHPSVIAYRTGVF